MPAYKDQNLHRVDYAAGELSSAENSGLAAIIRTLFPHDAIEAAVYERAACDVRRSGARAIAEEFALKMDEESAGRYGSKFEELPSVFRMEILRERGSEAGWSSFVQALAVHTYNQIELWELCGYEGASFHLGGYLNRGFDALDFGLVDGGGEK